MELVDDRSAIASGLVLGAVKVLIRIRHLPLRSQERRMYERCEGEAVQDALFIGLEGCPASPTVRTTIGNTATVTAT